MGDGHGTQVGGGGGITHNQGGGGMHQSWGVIHVHGGQYTQLRGESRAPFTIQQNRPLRQRTNEPAKSRNEQCKA